MSSASEHKGAHDQAKQARLSNALALGSQERLRKGDLSRDLNGLRVMLSANTAWNIVHFRAGIIRSLVRSGCEVIVIAPHDKHAYRLAEFGCHHVTLAFNNSGTSFVKDLILMAQYWSAMRRERPDIFLGFTIKPNIYGSFAAHLNGVPTVNNISGLGTAFVTKSWLTAIVRHLYRMALRQSRLVLFQNEDDRALFVTEGLVRYEQTDLLPGSGVDLAAFAPVPPTIQASRERANSGSRFLFVARLLRDKGIFEFVEAARIVRARFPNSRFELLGPFDATNRTAISSSMVADWVADGLVEHYGEAADVRPYIASSDCVVLPSYREGTPRALLEAAAMGKPIITTDVPGCRSVVDDGVNGLLCRPRDADDLAAKMIQFVEMSPDQRTHFGSASRKKAEREFSERIVIEKYLEAISQLRIHSET